jgi:hypothetical protein
MTGTSAMSLLTPDAEARLEEYCRHVRAAVARDAEADPDEVEADIRAHVAAEFRAAAGPVGPVELEAVLARLGPPEGWGPAGGEARPFDLRGPARAVRRWAVGVTETLWRGPEDWRLAYLALGLFLLGVLTAPLGVGVVLLLGAYLVGRAAVALAREKSAPLAARRWLVYPPILAFSLPLFLALAFWPLLAAGAGAEFVQHYKRVSFGHYGPPPTAEQVREANQVLDAIPGLRHWSEAVAGVFVAAGAIAMWWVILGAALWAFPRTAAVVFHPLLEGYTGRHGLKLAGMAALALLIWVGLAVRFAERAGLS